MTETKVTMPLLLLLLSYNLPNFPFLFTLRLNLRFFHASPPSSSFCTPPSAVLLRLYSRVRLSGLQLFRHV